MTTTIHKCWPERLYVQDESQDTRRTTHYDRSRTTGNGKVPSKFRSYEHNHDVTRWSVVLRGQWNQREMMSRWRVTIVSATHGIMTRPTGFVTPTLLWVHPPTVSSPKWPIIMCRLGRTRNSSGDEIANVNRSFSATQVYQIQWNNAM